MESAVRACEHCGRLGVPGVDVVWDWEYLGGRGHAGAWRCVNLSECWRRWDETYLVPVLKRAVTKLNARGREA
jgi:hypothetical protein